MNLKRLGCLTTSLSMLACGIAQAALPQPEMNPKPEDKIEVSGTVPENVATKLYTTWQTTTPDFSCKEIYALGDTRQVTVEIPVETEQASGDQRHWTVWRDSYSGGHCGWVLKGISVFADFVNSGLPADRKTNLSNSVAEIIMKDEPHPDFSWAMNDDASKPVYLYCKFSVLKNQKMIGDSPMIINPCSFGRQEHHGTDAGKKDNILRPDQHQVNFVLINMEQ